MESETQSGSYKVPIILHLKLNHWIVDYIILITLLLLFISVPFITLAVSLFGRQAQIPT